MVINKHSCYHDWINKLTWKDNTISYCFILLICGGPCHLANFKQYFGDLIFLLEQLVYSAIENKYFFNYFLINILSVNILSFNFFFKTT